MLKVAYPLGMQDYTHEGLQWSDHGQHLPAATDASVETLKMNVREH